MGAWGKPVHECICGICGKPFMGRINQKYCDEKCARVARRNNQARYRLAHGQEKKEPIVRPIRYDPYGLNILKTEEHQEWSRNYRRAPDDPEKFDRALAECRNLGISYAEKQRADSIKLFATVEGKE